LAFPLHFPFGIQKNHIKSIPPITGNRCFFWATQPSYSPKGRTAAQKCKYKLRPYLELGEYRIMPNHFHARVINIGADPRVCLETPTETTKLTDADNLIKEADVEHLVFRTSLHEGEHVGVISGNNIEIQGDHVGSPLHGVVGWFKTMTTNDYIRNVKQNGWLPFNKKLWQRNYFEHIIRKDNSFQLISNYIYNNPANWENDKFFVGRIMC
jgi:putative transposase